MRNAYDLQNNYNLFRLTCMIISSHETRLGSANASHKSKTLRRVLCMSGCAHHILEAMPSVCNLIFSSEAKQDILDAQQNKTIEIVSNAIVSQENRIGWEDSRNNANGVNHIVKFCIWKNSGNLIAARRNTRWAIHSTFAEPRSSTTVGISLVC